jgi:hypothetical protein
MIVIASSTVQRKRRRKLKSEKPGLNVPYSGSPGGSIANANPDQFSVKINTPDKILMGIGLSVSAKLKRVEPLKTGELPRIRPGS